MTVLPRKTGVLCPRVLQVKAIVITGKGPMFCGGAEITELLGRKDSRTILQEFLGKMSKMCTSPVFHQKMWFQPSGFPSKNVFFFAAKKGLNMFEHVEHALTKTTRRLNWWGNMFSRRT
jgi:hypothetical protein